MMNTCIPNTDHRAYRHARLLNGHNRLATTLRQDDRAYEEAWSSYTPTEQSATSSSDDFYSHETFWALCWFRMLQYFTILAILCHAIAQMPILGIFIWIAATTYVHRTGGQHVGHKVGAHLVPIVERLLFQNRNFRGNCTRTWNEREKIDRNIRIHHNV